MRSTDFGSKGMYKPTTAHGGKSNLKSWIEYIEGQPDNPWKKTNETVKFSQVPNLNLSGTTFDSNHMNKFMSACPFVHKQMP